MPDSPFLGNTEASLFQSYTGQNPEMGNLLTLSPVFYNVLLFFFYLKKCVHIVRLEQERELLLLLHSFPEMSFSFFCYKIKIKKKKIMNRTNVTSLCHEEIYGEY